MSKEKKVMRDVIGREIKVSQIVLFICTVYRGLKVSKVEKLTAQKSDSDTLIVNMQT